MPNKEKSGNIPDITSDKKPLYPYTLDKVGMRKMQIPIFLEDEESKIIYPAKVDALVNLISKEVKGIHMSRIYLLVCAYFKKSALSPSMLDQLMDSLISSQESICNKAYLDIDFQYIKSSHSLLSGHTGSRYYPVKIKVEKEEKKDLKIKFCVMLTYSSTCPCSAALSAQIISQKLEKYFGNETLDKKKLLKWVKEEECLLAATPHSQRSFAHAEFEYINTPAKIDINQIIEDLEKVLSTVVQAVVKRNDEQEFARLNAKNLMFCEDAARKLKNYFVKKKLFKKYSIKVIHEESLHAHDAVAETNS